MYVCMYVCIMYACMYVYTYIYICVQHCTIKLATFPLSCIWAGCGSICRVEKKSWVPWVALRERRTAGKQKTSKPLGHRRKPKVGF